MRNLHITRVLRAFNDLRFGLSIAPLQDQQEVRSVKKLFLMVAFLALAVPQFAKADHPRHRHVNGTEMSLLGFAGAIVFGGVGYLVLRRRKVA